MQDVKMTDNQNPMGANASHIMTGQTAGREIVDHEVGGVMTP